MPQLMVLSTRLRNTATRTTKQRVRVAQFGDGYSQETAAGINNQPETWGGLGWDNLTSGELATARSMLSAVGGTDYIRWTPPGDVSEKKYKVVDGWSESYQPGGLYSISFDLRQVF